MRYVSDSSYWLYLVHIPLMMVLQFVVRAWQVPAVIKYALVCVVACTLLLISYALFVRYTPIGTLLNGKRYRLRKAEPMAAEVLS
jgi:peptidoglycan/LPS O-acetylase OafA/YrhL